MRALRADDSMEELTEVLHRAYAGLAAQGLRFMATHQEASVTAERLNGPLSSIVEDLDSGNLVATVSLYRTDAQNSCAWYATDGVYHFGQFGVDPTLQAKGLGRLLMKRVEEQAAALGARELACDTAEPATHLVRWYNAMGYRFVQHVQWTEVNYRSVILSKTLP